MTFHSHRRAAVGVALVALALSALLGACGGADARKARYIEKAEQLIAEENYQKAQLELRNALQIDADDVTARVLMGEVAEQLGDPRAAVQMYRAALDLDSRNPAARARLAKLYVLGGLPDDAMKLVEAGLAEAPRDPELLAVRGAARARLGDFAAAESDVREALQADPANENAVALMAALEQRDGRARAAVTLVERALKERPKSVDLRLVLAQLYADEQRPADEARMLAEIIVLRPDEPRHRYRLAQFHVAQKNVDAAERVLRETVAARPDDIEAKKALVGMLAAQRSFAAGEKECLSLIAAKPEDAELRLACGDFYAMNGRAAAAAQGYQAVIESDGTGAHGIAARNRLAADAMRAKRVDEAGRLVGEVLAANPQDNDALIMRADLALARGDTAAAITDLRAVLRDQPTSVPVQRALARAYLENGNDSLAEETLRSAARDNPADVGLRMDLAGMLARSGKPQQAEQALQSLVVQSPKAIEAREALFRIQLERKDYVAARATADAVRTAHPEQALGSFLTGLVDRAEGKPEAAARSFESALRLQPDALEPLGELIALELRARRSDAALARLDAVIRTQPKNAFAHNLKGEVFVQRKQVGAALGEFAVAIELAPGWWVPYRGLGLATVASGRPEEAIAVFERGLAASDNAVPLATDLAELHVLVGHPERAIALYQRLLKNSPDNDLLANNLAMLLVTHRSDAKSLEEASVLAERFATSAVPAFLNTNGWVNFKLGRFDAAIPALERAANLAPDAPEMRYQLAMAQYKAGQRDAARRNLEAALKPGVTFAGEADARVTLAELRRS